MPGNDNLLSPEVVLDPYTYFGALRESEPVYWNEQLGGWILTRYDDVMAAFRDDRLSADRISPYYQRELQKPGGEKHRLTYDVLSRWMVFVDPPDHTRLRKLVDWAFRPRVVENLRPGIQSVIDELIAGLKGKRSFDFVEEFAYPLPVIIISDMFGVPASERDRIRAWSDDIMALVFGAFDQGDRHERARNAFSEFSDYLAELIEQRRTHPGGEDLISMLVEAGDRDDALTDREIIATAILALFGGHETTTNLLANGLKNLLVHPEQLARLRGNWDLLPTCIEEILRFDGPSKAMWRVALEPVEYGGRRIGKGDRLFLAQTAANRDPRVFDRPDEFDITRPKSRHCGFGYAAHYCIGAPIARMEGAMALRSFLEAFPQPELRQDAFDYQPTVLNRALKSLHIGFPEESR